MIHRCKWIAYLINRWWKIWFLHHRKFFRLLASSSTFLQTIWSFIILKSISLIVKKFHVYHSFHNGHSRERGRKTDFVTTKKLTISIILLWRKMLEFWRCHPCLLRVSSIYFILSLISLNFQIETSRKVLNLEKELCCRETAGFCWSSGSISSSTHLQICPIIEYNTKLWSLFLFPNRLWKL